MQRCWSRHCAYVWSIEVPPWSRVGHKEPNISPATFSAAPEAIARRDVDDLVGSAEIAERLGVKRHQVVHGWRRRYTDFPQPVADLRRRPIWTWPDAEAWARSTGRLTDPLRRPRGRRVTSRPAPGWSTTTGYETSYYSCCMARCAPSWFLGHIPGHHHPPLQSLRRGRESRAIMERRRASQFHHDGGGGTSAVTAPE